MKRGAHRFGLLLGIAALMVQPCAAAPSLAAYADFSDRRNPPPYGTLTPAERAAFDLGHAVFNTHWVPAGVPRAQRRDGLGPVFNAQSCDACHNDGARGQAPAASGPLPAGLVVQLADRGQATAGYGHVLNPAAIDGFAPEGSAQVIYEEWPGRYPDGTAWSLRVPRYELSALRNGALAPSTVIRPRLAPPLFGVGLLEAVPASALAAQNRPGRFGWQADAVSLAEQTARALSREMGLRSSLMPHDDCGAADRDCNAAAAGGDPEVPEEFVAALLAFQRWLAVPHAAAGSPDEQAGATLFAATGCAHCHRPELPVSGVGPLRSIRPYSDLRVHDLGADLADRDARANPVTSRWRTAPLWGLGHPDRGGRIASLLHDGRARSIEEAILWHGGEAAPTRDRFQRLDANRRAELLAWLAQL